MPLLFEAPFVPCPLLREHPVGGFTRSRSEDRALPVALRLGALSSRRREVPCDDRVAPDHVRAHRNQRRRRELQDRGDFANRQVHGDDGQRAEHRLEDDHYTERSAPQGALRRPAVTGRLFGLCSFG